MYMKTYETVLRLKTFTFQPSLKKLNVFGGFGNLVRDSATLSLIRMQFSAVSKGPVCHSAVGVCNTDAMHK